MNLSQSRSKGEKAQKLLDDPILVQAFADVREAIKKEFESSPIRDTEGIMYLRLMLKALSDVKANLERAVTDGKLAKIRLEDEEKRAKEGILRWPNRKK